MQKIQEEKKERLYLILLAAAIMIFVAQLNINLIINGFKISLAVICLPIFALLLEKFPVFPVTLIAAPGIFLVRSVVEWLNDGSWQEAFASYSPEMLFYLCYGGLFALYLSRIKFDSFKLVRLLPLIGIAAACGKRGVRYAGAAASAYRSGGKNRPGSHLFGSVRCLRHLHFKK